MKSKNILEEKFRVAMVKRGNMTFAQLAELLGASPSSVNKKFKRNNFAESDARVIADKLGCELIIKLKDKETGEEI